MSERIPVPSVNSDLRSKVVVRTRRVEGSATLGDISSAMITTQNSPETMAIFSRGERAHETVLLTEDNELLRQMVSGILREKGYNVFEAADAAEALALARQHEGCIDLLVADLTLPTMNGIELAQIVHSQDPGISVIYMSGYAADVLAAKPPVHRAAFLQKPFTPNGLLSKVREVLDSAEK